MARFYNLPLVAQLYLIDRFVILTTRIQEWPTRQRNDAWTCDWVDGDIIRQSHILNPEKGGDVRNTLWMLVFDEVDLNR